MSDPIAEFFAQYPNFAFHPGRDWRQIDAFNSLAEQQEWHGTERENKWEEFRNCWTNVVEHEFTECRIEHYQNLCRDLGLEPVPDSIRMCKRELKRVHVNIVDLMQYRRDRREGRNPARPQLFATAQELEDYTRRERKYYPLQNARAEMLRVLLKILTEE
jgi:hypothetical protein